MFMRKAIGSVALCLALAFGSFAQSGKAGGGAAGAPITLQRAIASGKIDAEIMGTGASSGDSIKLKVRKRAKGPVTVTVPPGTILRNSSGGEQDMVVSGVRGIDLGGGLFRPASRISLTSSSPVVVVLSAFCAAFEKDNPSTSATFSVDAPDPTLACITRRARAANLSVAAKQAAVWMYTDRISYEHMRQKFQVSPSEWSDAQSVGAACGISP
jgi:hypothetical protein